MNMKTLFRLFTVLLAVFAILTLIPVVGAQDVLPESTHEASQVVVSDLSPEEAQVLGIEAYILVAVALGLFGGLSGLLGTLHIITGNDFIIKTLERKYDAAGDSTKDAIQALNHSLDIIERLAEGHLPQIVIDGIESVDDFVEEISDGVPIDDKIDPKQG